MKMELTSFSTFLDRCLYKTITMQKAEARYWKHGDDTQAISERNSSIINVKFMREFVGRGEDDPEELA